MTKAILFYRNSLLTKVFMLVMLLVGGGSSAWGDDPYVNKLTFENSSIPSGWSDLGGYTKYDNNYLTATASYYTVQLTSANTVNLVSGQKIVIVAQTSDNREGASYGIRYEHKSTSSSWGSGGTVYSGSTYFPNTNTDYTITITIGSNQNEYIGFRFYGRVKIKSIDFQSASSTPAPTGFSSSVTAFNSASLNWTKGGEETNWQIKYNAEADFDPDKAGTMASDNPVTTNPYTLSGLSAETTYYAYVRAYIDADNQSDWTGPINFTTYEQYPTPVDLTLNSFTGTTATLGWTNGAGTVASKWQIKYSTSSGFNPDDAGTMIGDITTNPYTITGLTAGTTYYARIRADYGSSHYSDWNATEISFTPIDAWESFSEGIPSTWYNQDNHWSTSRSGYEGKASATSSAYTLRTPRLYATAGQTISFDVSINSGSLTARYYRNSRGSNYNIGTYTTSGTQTFTAPSDGYYWLQFTGYNCAIDNISGFGVADTEHLMEIGSFSPSTTGTVGGDYTASVTLRELGGTGETYTAELYYDGEKVAEAVDETIDANRDKTVSLSFTPTTAKSSKPLYIKIIYNNGTELKTTSKNVTTSLTTYILDETTTEGRPTGYVTNKVVWVKFTAQNGWNTICVPFVLSDEYLQQIFGSSYKIYKIKSYNNGELTFQSASSFTVSTPYLVYAPSADEVVKESIFLKSVYFNDSNYEHVNMSQTAGDATFQGTMATKTYAENDDWYGVTPAGKVMKAGSGASVKGYRAYFTGISAPSSGARISIVIDEGEGETTDLGFVKMVDENAKDIYTLSGQRVQKGSKGIYIVNGRKVVIK